jgi:hypothetical protein
MSGLGKEGSCGFSPKRSLNGVVGNGGVTAHVVRKHQGGKKIFPVDGGVIHK